MLQELGHTIADEMSLRTRLVKRDEELSRMFFND